MIYLIMLSLVSALCATEETTFLKGTPEEDQQAVRQRVVGSTPAPSQSVFGLAPATAERLWQAAQVVTYAGLAGHIIHRYGFLAGGVLAVWCASVKSESQSTSELRAEAPATADRWWKVAQVVSCVGCVAYMTHRYGLLPGGLSAVWLTSIVKFES